MSSSTGRSWRLASLAIGALALLAAAPSVAQASVEHPRLVVSAATEKSGKKVPLVSWGLIQLKNRALGTLECVNLVFGTAQNETEPGGEGNSEDVRAYGEVDGWSATAFSNASGNENAPRCKSSTGLEAWASAEPPPRLTTNTAQSLNSAATERLVYRGPFGGTASHHEPPNLPWREEAVAENVGGAEHTWLKTGIAMTERAQVEAEEAVAGIATERRTGCYREPPFTEIVHQPGYASSKETEPALRLPPQGCIKVNIISPTTGLETQFAGTLEPEFVNGTKNSLTASHGEFKGGIIIETEKSSERNERALSGSFGDLFVKSITPSKHLGYLHEELLQLK